MITGKQRGYLRSLANNLDPIIQVGKGGITENLLTQVEQALEAREIIKGTVLNNSGLEAYDVCGEIAQRTGAEPVQVIGNKFVLYKRSKENAKIVLP